MANVSDERFFQADNIHPGKCDPRYEADRCQWCPPCADRAPGQDDGHDRVDDLPGGVDNEHTQLQSSSFISQLQPLPENVHLHLWGKVQPLLHFLLHEQMLYKRYLSFIVNH